LIKDFNFISGLKPDLAKTSSGSSPFSLHLHMDECNLSCYVMKILKKKHSSADRENGKTVMEVQKGKKSYWG
jgi:hypothetical protein